MHAEAMAWVRECLTWLDFEPQRVLEFGSRDINGSARELFNCEYFGLDLAEGPGVDLVCDATDFREYPFDLVLCLEVLEHSPCAPEICRSGFANLRDRGVFVVTAGGIGRLPHSGVDGGEIREGEHYQNISASDLEGWLSEAGFRKWTVNVWGTDTRAIAIR